jgi:hypothetical protein
MKLVPALLLTMLAALAASPAYAQTEAGDNGGPDILTMALVTIGAVGGAAALATLLYLVRRAIGFDPHRPPEGEEGGGEH